MQIKIVRLFNSMKSMRYSLRLLAQNSLPMLLILGTPLLCISVLATEKVSNGNITSNQLERNFQLSKIDAPGSARSNYSSLIKSLDDIEPVLRESLATKSSNIESDTEIETIDQLLDLLGFEWTESGLDLSLEQDTEIVQIDPLIELDGNISTDSSQILEHSGEDGQLPENKTEHERGTSFKLLGSAINTESSKPKSFTGTQVSQASPQNVNELLTDGNSKLDEKKYDQAEISFDRALRQAMSSRNQVGAIQALSGKTAAKLGQRKYLEAENTATEALTELGALDQKYPDLEVDLLLRQGYAYLGQEKLSEVETTVKRVISIIAKLKDSEGSAGFLVSLADLQYALGDKDAGNRSAQRAVSFLQKNPDPSGAIAVLSRLAMSQYASEKPEETDKTLDRITGLIGNLKNQAKKINLLQAMGGLYLKLGEAEGLKIEKTSREQPLLEKARRSFEAAWAISPQNSSTQENVRVLLGFGRAYLKLKRNEEAVDRAQLALGMIQELEKAAGVQVPQTKPRSFFDQLGCRLERVVTRSSRCDDEDAELALLNQEDTVLKRMKIDARNIISAARLDQERFTESNASLRESLKITREIDDKLSGASKTLRFVQGLSGILSFFPIGPISDLGFYVNTAATGLDQMIALPQGGFSLLERINADIVSNSKRRSLDDLKQQQESARSRGDTRAEAETLLQLGAGYSVIGRYGDAGQAFKEAAALFKQLNQSAKQAEALLGSGRSLYLERNYQKAQELTEDALRLSQQASDSLGSANCLLTLGNLYLAQSKLIQASEYLQQAYKLFSDNTEKDAQLGKANTLLALGTVALRQRKYKLALQHTEEAIGIFQMTRNELESARARLVRGSAYQSLGNHKSALDDAQKALFVFKDLGDRAGEISALNNIGDVLQSQKRYEQAIKFYGLSAELQKDLQKNIKKPKPKTGVLINIFRASSFFLPLVGTLGQVGMKIYNALSIAQSIVYLSEEATTSLGSGVSYLSLGDYDQAMEAFDQVRKAAQNQDPQKEAEALLGLSNTRLSFDKDYGMARQDAERATKLFHEVGDRAGAAYGLLAQGIAYSRLGKSQSDLQKQSEYFSHAFDALQQATSIFQDSNISDLGGEAQAHSALGDLLVVQKQEGAAIAFYKKSIEATERIRQEIPDGTLSTSYIGNIVDTYRRLVELLLAQERVPEAQRVLELLKLQEVDTGVRAKIKLDGTWEYTKLEQQIIDTYKSFTALGQQLMQCGTSCSLDLKNQRNALNRQYEDQVKLLREEFEQRAKVDNLVFKPDALNSKAQRIVDPCKWLKNQKLECTSAERNLRTLLIYPFIEEDKNDESKYKLWLLWAGPQGVSVAFERGIDRQQFRTTVFRFYDLLSNRSNLGQRKELETVGAQLYTWLVKPLEKELQASKINNLVFALDRFIRYIPMAALFDSQTGKYLIQKGFQVSTIISAEATNVGDRLSSKNVTVLAMGLTIPKPGFNALTYVDDELKGIVQGSKNSKGAFPGLPLYDKDFTLENLQTKLERYRVLHLATHGEFVTGNSDSSYLVLGTGGDQTLQKLTIQDIDEKLSTELTNIHLVVLSACQTGLGGKISQVNERDKSEGVEIPGLSYSFMRGDRAKAVLASLWTVNDFSTARLMQAFYRNLANTKNPMTKAEALRQAQLSLLESKGEKGQANGERGSFKIQLGSGSETNIINVDVSHPYFWAPFILIGNGL